MNATVIKVRGWAWKERKGGTIKLAIEVHPTTEDEWLKALEMFKSKPEISVAVRAPLMDEAQLRSELLNMPDDPPDMKPSKVDTRYDRNLSSYSNPTVTPVGSELTDGMRQVGRGTPL